MLELSAGQRDLVTLRQLLEAGLSYKVVARLERDGVLHEKFRGVFKIGGPRISVRGRMLAAVLACGDGAALSHRDGAVLLEIPAVTTHSTIDVTVPRRGRRPIPGIDMHPVRHLDRRDVCVVDGIPVTTRPRTFVDLGDEYEDPRALKRVFHEAEVAGRFDPEAVRAALARVRGRDCRRVRAVLSCWEPHTKEEIEPLLEAIAQRAGLTDPIRNEIVDLDGRPVELDRYYPRYGLVLEADGFGTHRTRKRFHADRRRDRQLRIRLGIETFRYTWEDVTIGAADNERDLLAYVAARDGGGQHLVPGRAKMLTRSA